MGVSNLEKVKVSGFYLNAEKWKIFNMFFAGFGPDDLKDKYKVSNHTLKIYFQEWKKLY